MIVVSVMYPTTEGGKFDMDYYNATHIPLVKEAFGPTGLMSVQVLQGLPGPDGSKPPYVAIANLVFESPEALQKSMGGPRAAEVVGDIANFTDIAPSRQLSLAS
ncbi:EthD family reductase [Phenylobacterium sp. VNQ135]|uniref:EthD family reductase n=1 Tax=Phenylobacterium sp. VNQ135 TaxID=3400922 RepID=UPI003C114A33